MCSALLYSLIVILLCVLVAVSTICALFVAVVEGALRQGVRYVGVNESLISTFNLTS